MTSPYRSAGRPRSHKRTLAFYHARFMLLSAIASVAVMCGLSCVVTPRSVTLQCVPGETASLACRSTVRSIWGESRPLTTEVVSDGAPVPLFPLAALLRGERQRPWLDIDIEYHRRQRESWSRIVAKYDHGQPVALTEILPVSFGGPLITDLYAFSRTLRGGKQATLKYETGWHGLLFAVMTPLLALLLLWLSSGRTRVVFDSDAAEVEIKTRNYWLSRVEERRIPLAEIAAVQVACDPAARGGTLHRPALRLRSGEIVALGRGGLKEPARAEHWAAQLRKLLELPA